mmetsp:Transcript_28908/g.93202  ORF Transcript_28908/g.93202 Transcript_28908/m.93202 type:complete len:282 (+) Transcript_28908:485-1330(+)
MTASSESSQTDSGGHAHETNWIIEWNSTPTLRGSWRSRSLKESRDGSLDRGAGGYLALSSLTRFLFVSRSRGSVHSFAKRTASSESQGLATKTYFTTGATASDSGNLQQRPRTRAKKSRHSKTSTFAKRRRVCRFRRDRSTSRRPKGEHRRWLIAKTTDAYAKNNTIAGTASRKHLATTHSGTRAIPTANARGLSTNATTIATTSPKDHGAPTTTPSSEIHLCAAALSTGPAIEVSAAARRGELSPRSRAAGGQRRQTPGTPQRRILPLCCSQSSEKTGSK